jgi:hypothetical protein
LIDEEEQRREVEGVEGADGCREGLLGAREDRLDHLQHGHTREKVAGGFAVARRATLRVQAGDELVFQKPGRHQRLFPQAGRRSRVLRTEVGQGHGGVEVDH